MYHSMLNIRFSSYKLAAFANFTFISFTYAIAVMQTPFIQGS